MDIPLKLSDKLYAYNLYVNSKSARFSIFKQSVKYSLRFLRNLNEKIFEKSAILFQNKCPEFALSLGMNDLTHSPLNRR